MTGQSVETHLLLSSPMRRSIDSETVSSRWIPACAGMTHCINLTANPMTTAIVATIFMPDLAR